MKVTAALPAGVSALFFDTARRRRRLEERLVADLEEAGFSEVVLPILDYLDPYEPLLNAASRGELYRFIDRDGEQLALRSDFTSMLARLIAPRLESLELPLDLFYRGDVVRFQEEQAGRRERELYQLGAELLGPYEAGDDGAGGDGFGGDGAASAAADRRALRLFLSLLESGGGAGGQVVLGFAGALDPLLLAAPAGERSRLADAVARRERRRAREASPALLEVVEHGRPADPSALGEQPAARLVALATLVDELAEEFPRLRLTIDLAEYARYTLDPELAAIESQRGYYDGIAFRAYLGGWALPVGGGGRYDRLFARLGAPVSAVGFSLGLDRLASAAAETATAGTGQEGA
jgi:ATP phosphoribosyltransferase regulatory subunit